MECLRFSGEFLGAAINALCQTCKRQITGGNHAHWCAVAPKSSLNPGYQGHPKNKHPTPHNECTVTSLQQSWNCGSPSPRRNRRLMPWSLQGAAQTTAKAPLGGSDRNVARLARPDGHGRNQTSPRSAVFPLQTTQSDPGKEGTHLTHVTTHVMRHASISLSLPRVFDVLPLPVE